MALTGTHALGDSGRIADDNLRDVSINANAAAIATKTTPSAAADAAAALIASEHDTERAYQSSTYGRVFGVDGAYANGVDAGAYINTRITAASATGGGVVDVSVAGVYTIETPILGASKVTLRCAPGVELKAKAGINEDVIVATGVDGFHAIGYGAVIDGNKANQTGTALSGDDATIKRRGVFLTGCTRSSVKGFEVKNCRLHGVLIYLGSDNTAEDIYAHDNGLLASTCYGQGILIWDSPRFNGKQLRAVDNDANSGVATKGANAANISLSGVHVSGAHGASGISLNSEGARLSDFYVTGTVAGFTCLNLGHDSAAEFYCDNPIVSDGLIEDSEGWGIHLAGSLGAMVDNVTVTNVAHNSLRITGQRAGKARFTNCLFDGVTVNNTADRGQPVLITSAGGATAYGDVDFINCHARGGLRSGVHVIGASGVRWHGGTVRDNTGPGLYTADDGALLSGGVVSIGTTFNDTRVGAARTQTIPMQTTGTAGKSLCLNYHSDNHLTSNVPTMTGATSDVAFGYQGQAGALSALLVTPGTASAPGHSFQGRPNQGMYSLGGSTVGFASNGLEQARFDQTKWTFLTPIRPGVYTTATRPAAATVGAGFQIYDSTLGLTITSNGTAYVNGVGTVV